MYAKVYIHENTIVISRRKAFSIIPVPAKVNAKKMLAAYIVALTNAGYIVTEKE